MFQVNRKLSYSIFLFGVVLFIVSVSYLFFSIDVSGAEKVMEFGPRAVLELSSYGSVLEIP